MSEYVEFAVNNSQRFERLQSVFAALKHDKDADDFRPDEDWRSLFDQKALDCFEWPTAEERAR